MSENHSYFAALIIVALAAPAAAILLLIALVVWLAELVGSLILPCLLLGVFLALLATIIYKVSLRDAVQEAEARFSAIYELAKLIRDGVEWALRLFSHGAK